jgi:hypothetical protein
MHVFGFSICSARSASAAVILPFSEPRRGDVASAADVGVGDVG